MGAPDCFFPGAECHRDWGLGTGDWGRKTQIIIIRQRTLTRILRRRAAPSVTETDLLTVISLVSDPSQPSTSALLVSWRVCQLVIS